MKNSPIKKGRTWTMNNPIKYSRDIRWGMAAFLGVVLGIGAGVFYGCLLLIAWLLQHIAWE